MSGLSEVQMNFYKERVLPRMIDCACSSKSVMALRAEVIPLAYGEVLEIGIGSALNLCLYDSRKVSRIIGLEPSRGMRERADRNLHKSPVPMEWLMHSAEDIPLADNSVDSIVSTYTLCSIPNWQRALKEMKRVLKPNGRFFYCEHGLAPDVSVEKWQNRMNWMWGVLSGGCNLNRPIVDTILSTGFSSEWNQSMYIEEHPKVFSYTSIGVAAKLP